jgi:hypothetical protein
MVLFSRSVHPELFRIYRTHHVQRSNYKARLDITSDGHIITFSCGSMTLCEVIASQNQMLPQKRLISGHRVTERKHYETENKNLVHYETDFSVETASREMFWKIQDHFGRCSGDHELLQVFNTSGRVALGAISYMHVEERSKRLTVQAFHTFPDEYSILKSVSTFTVTR